jgi:NarL family two-component system response regulator LiaR
VKTRSPCCSSTITRWGGLTAYLEVLDDIRVIGEGAALRWLATASAVPDVILMDLMMPGIDGVAATEEIVGAYSSLTVVVLTSFR